MRNLLADGVRSLARLFVDGARVFAAHWPQLAVLFLLGWAGRMGFLWLATVASNLSGTVALFIVPLAPLSTLLSMVLMLRVLAPSLSAFQGMLEPATAAQRFRDDLTVAAQVLLPFLAVYASAGLLRQDVHVFLVDAWADESLNSQLINMDYSRTLYAEGWVLIVMIVAALVIRKIITMRELSKKSLKWAALATYLEVLWMVSLANAFTTQLAALTEWVTTRRVVAGVLHWYEQAVAVARAWGGWATTLLDAVTGFIGSLGSLILVPVAWLAIGAAVYGHKLKSSVLKVETQEEIEARQKALPPVKRIAARAAEPVATPVRSAMRALAQIASAGIIPMVLFCVSFAVAVQVQTVVAQGMRLLFGPGTAPRNFALEPYAVMAERGVYFMVALTLLAVAVNVVVESQKQPEPEPASVA
ncbi:MAG: hypothetical protein Q4G35_06635 [Propionibacteriaceae bacterium]|nr:hypothetical protein [Propionibacteriaceae bacterium]